jgi:hypothetical protein
MAITLMAFFFPYTNVFANSPEELQEKFTEKLDDQLNDTFKSLDMLKEAQKSITREQIAEQFAAKPILKKITTFFPKIIDFVTNVIKDENVMPELIKMMKRKKDLLRLLYINIGLFIFSFIWKFTYRKKDFFSISYLGNMFMRFFTINGLRIYALIYLFGDNLSPLWNVFKNTFEVLQ